MAFHPYLFFSGTCREAFTRYQEVFGGELYVMTMGEAPGETPPGVDPNMVIHAALTIGDALLMASDDPTGDGGPKVGISVSYNSPDPDEVRRVFDALAEGGEVSQPLIETFFSPAFGMCTDRFGIPWMFSADKAQPS
jgi:PhnB protein